jgi:hypothetical protein
MNTVEFKPYIILEEQYKEVFKLILQKDSNWRSKNNLEKWEVVNLVRKELLLPPIPQNAGIVETLTEMQTQILYLKVKRSIK